MRVNHNTKDQQNYHLAGAKVGKKSASAECTESNASKHPRKQEVWHDRICKTTEDLEQFIN